MDNQNLILGQYQGHIDIVRFTKNKLQNML